MMLVAVQSRHGATRIIFFLGGGGLAAIFYSINTARDFFTPFFLEGQKIKILIFVNKLNLKPGTVRTSFARIGCFE